jgi:hypothetical protein
MRRAVPVLLTALVGLAPTLVACSSGAEPAVDAPMDAAMGDGRIVDGTETFNAMIRPLVRGCVGCHSSGSTEPNLSSYLALAPKYTAKPGARNVLVTKADATNGIHYGLPYLDVDGKQIVARWIDSLPSR